MLKIIFTIVTLTQQGPVMTDVQEKSRFKDQPACAAFGETMSPRMQDWVRGVIRADWDHPVSVAFRCETDGEPS